jgi:RimJ/RimL family protein N-acetyltransferase
MVHNQRALALYHKLGFEIEGRHHGALKVDRAYIDEYTMCKILE